MNICLLIKFSYLFQIFFLVRPHGLDSNVTKLLANLLTKSSVFYCSANVFCNLVSIKIIIIILFSDGHTTHLPYRGHGSRTLQLQCLWMAQQPSKWSHQNNRQVYSRLWEKVSSCTGGTITDQNTARKNS